MKATTQSSKLNQKDSAAAADQAKQQPDAPNTVPTGSVVTADTTSKLAGEQFDLPLEVADTLAMNTDETDDTKKRKDKKEDDDKNDKRLEVAEESEVEANDSEAAEEESTEEVSEESLVSDALESQSNGSVASSEGSGLSMTTLFLGAASLLGASSFYKNSEEDSSGPVFSSDADIDEIEENSGTGQVIYTAVAVSEGLSVTYSLSSDSSSAVSIDSATGEVTLNVDPDHEVQGQYVFTVIAADDSGKESQQPVTLVITNLDDTAPTITSNGDAVSIEESTGAGQVVYTATADDSADVSSGDIVFSLTAGSDSDLSIDASTGEVTLNADPVHDVKSQYDFTVTATDAAGNQSAGQSLSLNIIKVVNLDENSGDNQVIYTATADGLTDGVTFSLADDSDSSVSIDATSGEVSLATDPDHETQSVFNFAVTVTDAAGSQVAEKLVSLKIRDLDDVAPLITSAGSLSLDENISEQKIYDVVVDDSGDDIQDPVFYGFLDDSGSVVTALEIENGPSLKINDSSGEITLNGSLDYEAKDTISFILLATNDKDFLDEGSVNTKLGSVKQIVLSVNNLDDTAPSIVSEDVAASIDENGADNQLVYTAIADDSADISDGFTYSISGADASKFSIDANTGAVTLNAAADFENQETYSFDIVATDTAGNASTAKSVSMDVNNLDEVAPTITSDDAVADLDENSGAGQIIYTATANDSLDISDGVVFSLSEGSDPALSIDASTGAVTLLPNPDFETKPEYNFDFIATDAAGNTSDPKALTLKISNVDDTAPIITSGATADSIPENSGAGQVVYTALSNEGGGIVGSTPAPVLESVVTVPELAADTQHIYVSESTKSEDGSQVTVKLSYLVDDPTLTGVGFFLNFDSSVLSLDSVSGVAGGAIASGSLNDDGNGLVFAWSDPFGGNWPGSTEAELATVTFNVTEGATGSSTLEIVRSSNAVGFTFDGQSHDVVIAAASESEPVVTASEPVVTIPELAADTQHIYVSESSLSEDGTQITVKLSYLADDPTLTGVGFFFNFDSSVLNLDSVIDVANGAIASGSLNDDGNGLVFAWSDPFGGNWPGSTEAELATVTFNIAQGTTGTTVFDIVRSSNAVGFTFDGQSHEAVISDPDPVETTSSSSVVTFSLTEDSDAGLAIDQASGEVSLLADADFETQPQFNFGVIATDDAGNVSQAQAVTLNIDNLDEVAPEITSSDTAAVLQSSGPGAKIYQATADDSQDVSGDDGLTFSLSGADAAEFEIDAETGTVILNADPNDDASREYSFDVIATDDAGNQSEAKSVVLSIIAQDLVAPVFTSADSAVAIDEKSGTGQVVYTATTTDETVVTYNLAGEDANKFVINGAGEVSLIADPDYETQSAYSFDIVATDTAGNISTPKTVTLAVNNLDESAPTITSDAVAAAIDENTGAGQVIYTATADDSADITDNEVTFSLSEDSDADLSIDGSTGEVTLSVNPDYEPTNDYTAAKNEYIFTVIATDTAGNATTGQPITLTINNVDDAPPTITSGDTADTLDSLSGGGQVVYTAIADDSGDAISDGVTFSLAGSDAADFKINDPSSGEVILANNPNYSIKSEYNFDVIATDAAGNVSEAQSVILKIDDLAPFPASVSFTEDTGVAADNISSDGELTVSGLKFGAKWEYSTNNGLSWNLGSASADSDTATIPTAEDGVYQVVIRQTNNSIDSQTGEPRSSDSEMVEFTVDTTAPEVQLISADSATGIITIAYNEELGVSSTPNPGDYVITQGGDDLTVSNVEVDANNPQDLLLTIDSVLDSGALRVEYIPSDSLAQDIAGNTSVDGFSSMIVSDGYIRGAEIYIDRGEEEGIVLLEGYTTDEFGQLILPDSVLNAPENIGHQLIIQGGINMDTGAPNEIELKAPVDYNVINPLSTLVATVVDSGVKLEDAETQLAEAFGIELDGDSDLGSYDPLSDPSDSALENRVIVTQIATVLAVASAASNSSSDDAEAAALSNLADIVKDQNRVGSVTLDSEQLTEILSVDGKPLVETEDLDTVVGAVSDMTQVLVEVKEAREAGLLDQIDREAQIEKIVQAQAEAIDKLAPNAPIVGLTAESDLGISSEDGLTNDTTPTVLIAFDTFSNDGRAVVIGDTVEIFNSGKLVEAYTLTEDDIENQSITRDLPTLEGGNFFVSASVTDRAGNASFVSSLKITVDVDAPDITSSDIADAVDENSAADLVIYTPTSSSDDLWKFELGEQSDPALYLDAEASAVKISASPDFELQSQYVFTLIATDNAGNTTEQAVTLSINNVDEVAPTILSGDSVTIEENSGADQVIYIATADDSADISEGVAFSLTEDSDAGLNIDASTGEVSLSSNPDYEVQTQYNFAVIATDTAGNASEAKAVTANIANIDDIAPTITSSNSAVVLQSAGANAEVYQAVADDSVDISDGFAFSLAGADASEFTIDAETGLVRLIADPINNPGRVYSFDVIATDTAGNASDSQSVSLSILSVDLTDPVIDSSETATAIDEDTGANQIVYRATSIDQTIVSYSLSDADADKFTIDSVTGEVTLLDNPNYEEKSDYSFTVTATDSSGNVSEPKTVTLAVNNLDEFAPTITSDSATIIVDENTGADLVIYTATADDSADISGGFTFSLTEDSDVALSIDEVTGEVTLSVDADFETQPQYSFGVVATDARDNVSQIKSLSININNLDEVAPTIISSLTDVFVDENISTDEVIFSINADDTGDISSGVTYSLSGTDANAFSISNDEATSGEVIFSKSPNYEAQKIYSFNVIIEDSAGNSTQEPFTVSINNLDEVAPRLTSSDKASVDENIGAGQVVYRASADDSADISGGVTYSLVEGSDPDLIINARSGEVTLTGNPNFETKSEYSFEITAVDAAGNRVTQTKSVTLNIDNVDEVAPTVISSDSVVVLQTAGPNVVIYVALADDSVDAGEEVTFSLSGADAAEFTIDKDSGEVRLIADPNDEPLREYSFDVVASDGVNSSSAKSVTMVVTLDDPDAPIITSEDSIEVNEGVGLEEVIYTATATDKTAVTFALAGADADKLSIDSSSGAVRFIANPDFETQSEYSFEVIATDSANPQNTSEPKLIALRVNNLDEVAPTLAFENTVTTINENTGAGQVILDAIAEDTDFNDSKVIKFSLDGNDANLLSIDQQGQVTLIANPDNEAKSRYEFSVIATDNTGNFTATDYSLAVTNLDDAAPEITSDIKVDAIDENSGAGQVIYTAAADDSADISGGVDFSLSGTDANEFDINASSGAVTLLANPDADIKSTYSFTVVATDKAGNVGSKALTLVINNLDEVAPTITSGVTSIKIDENSGAGQAIYTATADDSADISGGVDFSLSGIDAGEFDIDASTGVVTLLANPDAEAQSEYSFEVVATDVAGNSSEAQSVTLEVNNLDDFPPDITSGDTADAIAENSGAAQVVYTATAIDNSGNVIFSLSGTDADKFDIDAASGEVTLLADPDFETQSQYSFTLIAGDNAGNKAEQEVTLSINNLDDTAPTFLSSNLADVYENSGANQVIYTAIVDDSADVSDGVSFSLSEDSDDALSINASRGEVTLSNNPVHETQNEYDFTVIAADNAGNSTEQSVTLKIIDLDSSIIEERVFDQVIFTAETNETGVTYSIESELAVAYEDLDNIKIQQAFVKDTDGSYIMQLSLSESAIESLVPLANSDEKSIENFDLIIGFDPDDIDLGSVSYIRPDSDSAFNLPTFALLGDNSGIAISQILFDPSMPVNSATVIGSVKFKLKDGVDSAQFDVNQFLVNADQFLVNPDDDQINSSSVTLLTSLDADLLTINENTGEVSLAVADYETHAQYGFEVMATDAEGNASGKQAVIVRIIDIAEVAPEITSVQTVNAIDENSDTNQVVYTAVANTPIATFRLTEDSDPALTINAITGDVTLAGDPDFETRSQYSFTIIANTSKGDSDPINLTLSINNLDEIAPNFISGDTAGAIDENTGAGQVIYTATANDSDFNGSEEIIFTLSGDSDSALSINEDTGAVTLADDPDFEAQSVYNFGVIATDAAGKSSEQSVSLSINDINESGPVIDSENTVAAINENSGAGQLVYTVTSVGPSATYSLEGVDANKFSIDANTGAVTLTGNPNFEAQSQYSFTVVATGGPLNLSDSQEVTLGINNLDEVAPTITSGTDAGSVDEGGAAQVVYTAEASDSDFNGSEQIIFSLSGADAASFSINSASGAVTFAGSADFDIQPAYSFNVIATDAAGNASAAKVVTLTVKEPAEPLAIISDDTAEPIVSVQNETVISVPDLVANTQHVYVSESTKSEDGTQVTVKLSYLVDDPTLTGIGFTLDFDSSVLSLDSVSGVASGAIASGNIDPSGDALIFAWSDPFGGSWPGSTEAELATVTFAIDDEATGLTELGFTQTSIPPGYDFDGQSQQVAITESGGSQAIYTAEANLEGTTFELVDNTDYPLVGGESVVTVPELVADTQHVYVSESTKSEDGTQVTVKLSYLVDDPTLTGIGFTLDFDSSVLSLDSVSGVASGAIASGNIDPSGDALIFAWSDPFGGSWPGSTEAELATVTFAIDDEATGLTELGFTQTSIPPGYDFDGQSQEVEISPAPMSSQLSIDSATGVVTLNGVADSDVVSEYNFTIIANNGDKTASQDVTVTVDSSDQSQTPTKVSFSFNEDSIDLSDILMEAGYTLENSPTNILDTDISGDILDLISNEDSGLDNLFGGSLDEASNVLTVFADTNSEQGVVQIESGQIQLGEDSTLDEDDVTALFIA